MGASFSRQMRLREICGCPPEYLDFLLEEPLAFAERSQFLALGSGHPGLFTGVDTDTVEPFLERAPMHSEVFCDFLRSLSEVIL